MRREFLGESAALFECTARANAKIYTNRRERACVTRVFDADSQDERTIDV